MLSADQDYICRRVIALAALRGRFFSLLSLALVFRLLLVHFTLGDGNDPAGKFTETLERR
jgi:hypothetical protein